MLLTENVAYILNFGLCFQKYNSIKSKHPHTCLTAIPLTQEVLFAPKTEREGGCVSQRPGTATTCQKIVSNAGYLLHDMAATSHHGDFNLS